MEWAVQLPILFFSIMFHEVAHGWVALRHGDDTALRAGRLSFNPLDHIDPVGSILLPFICLMLHMPLIGWAKPVPVDPRRMRDARVSMMKVAAAGPASNILLSLAAAIVFKLVSGMPSFGASFQVTLMRALIFAVMVNLFLAFFNLLPIHPLDGSKVLSGLLPFRYRLTYERHAPYGFMIIMALLYTGIIKILVLTPTMVTVGFLARVGLLS